VNGYNIRIKEIMYLGWIDLAIVIFSVCVVTIAVYQTKKHTRSVAQFLAAERCARRYLLSVAQGMAFCGAVAVIALFEMFYKAGFTVIWWSVFYSAAAIILTLSGWIIYRFRTTRSLTLAQFFEKRYSKNFRIFAGSICFIGGLLNFAIFPGIGSRFFVYFCGLPHAISIFGLDIPVFIIVMFILLTFSVLYAIWGGQLAILVADFIQGSFSSIVFLLIIGFFLYKIDWSAFKILLDRKPDESLINPFDARNIQNFNCWYFIIGAIGLAYNWMGFQGAQGFNASAKSAHEARMGGIVGHYRGQGQALFFLFVPICAYIIMNHSSYALTAQSVNQYLSSFPNPEEKFQMLTPMVLSHILPTGMKGLFVALMLAAFISNADTYLHSWASIFVQDVILPFRKKPFEPRRHMLILRLTVISVALFVFCFSIFYNQVQHIVLYFAVTGAIFGGGSGAVIIGGLYWKRGTTTAAYCSMIIGSTIAVGGLVLKQIYEGFWIDGQWCYLISMVIAASVYVIVSLLGKSEKVNFDQLFHRGEYAIKDEAVPFSNKERLSQLQKLLGMTKEFSTADKIVYYCSLVWGLVLVLLFLLGTFCYFIWGITPMVWLKSWYIYVLIMFSLCIVITIWITVGGVLNMRSLFKEIAVADVNELDDGRVVGHVNLGELNSVQLNSADESIEIERGDIKMG
jgi:SSS family solute:Na+ symporter